MKEQKIKINTVINSTVPKKGIQLYEPISGSDNEKPTKKPLLGVKQIDLTSLGPILN